MTPELVAMWAEQQGITPEQAKQKAIEGLQNITAQAQQKQKEWDQQQAAQQQQQQQQQAPAQTQQDTGALANVGDDDQQQDTKTVYMISDHGSKLGASVGSSWIYMKDRNTGQTYAYDQNEGKSGDMGWHGATPPKDADLQITSWIDTRGDESTTHDVSDQNLTFGGQVDPETSAAWTLEQQKDDKSDNDIWYDVKDPVTGETRSYVDVSGTGQGIPVGAFNITRDPTQLGSYDAEGNYTEKDPSTYTSPVLSKGFTQYHDQVTDQSSFKSDIAPPSKDLTFGNVFSINPYGAVIDTGLKNPFGEGNIEFSNPPSQLHNLEPFFNQAESFGYENYKKQFDDDPSWLEKQLGVQPVPKSVGEMIQETGGSNIFPDQGDSGGGSGGGGDGDDDDGGGGGGGGDDDDSTTPPKFAFAPPMKSDPISTAPDEPINTDPRFQPIFPQKPIQPVEGLYPIPTNPIYGGPATPQASPAMPQPQPIPIEAQPAQSVPPVISPPTFADVMAQGGTQGQAGINPYFQAIEQLNASSPYSPIMGMAGGGGIMSLQNRMLMDPASRAMSQGIMS